MIELESTVFKKYSIVIPTYNHLQDCLIPCIESIVKNTDLLDVEVIVVANGCTDGTKDYVQGLGDNFKLVWIEEPAGYTIATNEGIKASKGRYIILLNNDNVILDFFAKNEWLRMLERPFLEQDNVGITGAAKRLHHPTESEFLLFFCVMISREVINRVGILDEIFNPGYGEDIDYCIRLKNLKYKVLQVPKNINLNKQTDSHEYSIGFPIWHKSSQTVSNVPGWESIVLRNEKILAERYIKSNITLEIKRKFMDNMKKSLRIQCIGCFQEIFEHNFYNVFKEEIENRNILDIGSNIGIFSFLCEEYNAKKIIAFEPYPENFKSLSNNVDFFSKNTGYTSNIIAVNKAVSSPNIREAKIKGEGLCPKISINGDGYDTRCISLKEALDYFPKEDKDIVIKLDCEGSEYDIVFGADKEDLLRCKIIYAEFHNDMHENEKYNYDILEKYLVNAGYDSVHVIKPNVCSGNWFPDDNGELTIFIPVYLTSDKNKLFKFVRNDKKKKVYDCFTFFNELDILEIRLNELDPYVDYFVLSEMSVTHSGKSKPLYFEQNKERFSKFLHKIIHIKIDDCPNSSDPWIREHYQRNCIMTALDKCNSYDIVIISDVDEIPRGSKICEYTEQRHWMYFEQKQYNYYLNLKTRPLEAKAGVFSRISTYGNMNRLKLNVTDLRYRNILEEDKILDGGWHFTWIGGPKKIIYKLESWAHQEINVEQYKNLKLIDENINKCIDAFGRENILHGNITNIDDSFPEYIIQNAKNLEEIGLIKKQKVYDCFMFFNELDILEIRLNELSGVVDKFVLVEGNKTHQGKDKPLYFKENKERFNKFLDKIIHIEVTDFPPIDEKNEYSQEVFQRNAISRGLTNCSDNDVIVISDVDEIPSKESIINFNSSDGICALSQSHYCYYINYVATKSKWTAARIGPYNLIKQSTPSKIRAPDNLSIKDFVVIENAGWHFSWLGGTSNIIKKIKSFSHRDFNNEKYLDENFIDDMLLNKKEIFNRDIKWDLVKIDNTYPSFIINNLEYFRKIGFISNEKDQVAIVMPYYNDINFITKSVKAILDQSYTNWRLFIIDDGSNVDKKANIVLGSLGTDSRIRIIEKENGGVSSARNAALNLIRNDSSFTYIAYCDSDDVWTKEYLESQINNIKEYDLIYSEVNTIFENGNIAFTYGIPNPPEYPGLDFMLSSPFIYISSVLHKRDCLSVGDFDSRIDSIEDWDMWVRIAKSGYKFKKNKFANITYTAKISSNMASMRTYEKDIIFNKKHMYIKRKE